MKTAVEWLENQIKNSKYFYKLMEDINSRSTIAQIDIFEQAKEMEKQQNEIMLDGMQYYIENKTKIDEKDNTDNNNNNSRLHL
jgi:hypothetical protein